jgi:CelD/BcsL family acetyltransferase involved in cellulose biosynthesis
MKAVLAFIDAGALDCGGLVVGELDPQSPTLARLMAWAHDHRYLWLHREHRTVPYVDLPESFDTYLGSLSSNMRYHVRRRRREMGDAQIRIIRRGRDVDFALEAFFDLHRRRWERDGLPGNFREPSMQAFLCQFCHAAAQRGWLRIYELSAGGRTQCVMIAFHRKGIAYYYQMGWDPDATVRSPGVVVMAESIEQAIREGLRRYDFLRGDEAYKQRWTSTSVEQMTFVVARCPSARVMLAAEGFKNRIKSAVTHYLGEQAWATARRVCSSKEEVDEVAS